MRDARQHGWYPGVSSINRQEAQPGLQKWIVRQAILSALTHPKAHEIADADELIAVLEADSREQVKQAAIRGKQIHAAIESFFQTGNADTEYADFITGVRGALRELTGSDDPAAYEVETAACHEFGYGGRVDLYSRSLNIVLDLKGKEFGPDDKIKGYTEQGRQLVSYREMLGMPTARLVNVYVSRNNPGLVVPYEWPTDEHQGLWRQFCWLLGFWQCKNGFPLRLSMA